MDYQLKILTSDENASLLCNIYKVTQSIERCYPQHRFWFYNKFIKGLNSGERTAVYAELSGEVVGVVLLKCSPDEKKICTIYVDENYRSRGIGTNLLNYAFEILKTTKPHITISKEKVAFFQKVIDKYDWTLNGIYKDMYAEGKEEYVYNEK